MVQLPVKGQLRYNGNTDNWEIYNGLTWCVKVDEPCDDQPKWEKWWAWKPVRINGRWTCFKTVYRRQPWLEHNNYPGYEYGTLFDVIKDS